MPNLDTSLRFQKSLLPLELYSIIIGFLSERGDLLRICLTCHYFLQEGRRSLYRDNKFPHIMKMFPKFISTILRSPHLAGLVQGLTLHFPEYLQGLFSKSGRNLIHDMFATLKNLRRLAIAGLSPRSLVSLLSGCSFQLESFKTNTHLTQELVHILANQTRISEWTYLTTNQGSRVPVIFPGNFMPRLSVLSIPAQLLIGNRAQLWPISRLNLDLSGYGAEKEEVLGDVLKHFGPTLISLSLGRLTRKGDPQTMGMIPMIARFAEETPNIRFIGISDDNTPTMEDVLSLPESPWACLKDLQTFVCWVDDGEVYDYRSEDPASPSSLSSTPLSSTFATHLALACPTLQRLIFVSKDDDAGFTWSEGKRKQVPWRMEMEHYTSPGAWAWA